MIHVLYTHELILILLSTNFCEFPLLKNIKLIKLSGTQFQKRREEILRIMTHYKEFTNSLIQSLNKRLILFLMSKYYKE